jgi:flagellar biosynthetic protein FliR
VLSLIAAAPVLNNKAVPVRARIGLGVAIAVALVPALPPAGGIDPGSPLGLLLLVQQVLIGVAMGLAMRLVFAAIDVAGEVIGFQMSLSFATAFDPQNGGQSAVVQEFLGLLATLTFLAIDGHLMLIAALAHSFKFLPLTETPLLAAGWGELARAGGYVFAAGVMLALPLIATLLVTSIALGVLTRAAPALNVFAVGFPITLSVGFAMLALSLEHLSPNFQRMFMQGMQTIDSVLRGLAP